jgi:thiol-disulfide isomerase/thioredoxin
MNFRIVTLPDSNIVSLYDYNCNGFYNDKEDKILAGDFRKDQNYQMENNPVQSISSRGRGRLLFSNKTYQLKEVDPEGNWLEIRSLNLISDRREKLAQFSYWDNREKKFFKPGTGQYTLLYFWGSWCPGCHSSAPIVQDLNSKYAGEVDVREFNFGDSKESRSKFLEKLKLSFDPYIIDQKNLEKLNINGFPFYILVDNKGIVIKRTFDESSVDSLLSTYLAKKSLKN